MRNIKFNKEILKDEAQLKSGRKLLSDDVEVKQMGTLPHRIIPAVLFTSIIITTAGWFGIFLLKHSDKPAPEMDIFFALKLMAIFAIYFIIFPYIHELIHGMCYPSQAVKNVWKRPTSFFVYCEAQVSKKRMIAILIMPLFLLAVIPYIAWLWLLPELSATMAYILLIADLYIVFTCISDIGAVWVIAKYVPRNAEVFSRGFKFYYRKTNRRS